MIKYDNATIISIIFNKQECLPNKNFLNKINELKNLNKNVKFEQNNKIDSKIDNGKIDSKIDNKIDNSKIDNSKIDNSKIDNSKIDSNKYLNKSFEHLRNYKTKFTKDDSVLVNIRNILNKITEKTYEKLVIDLITNIQLIYDNDLKNKDEITLFIFNFFTKNQFMSKIYANIYNILCNKYDDFNNIINSNIIVFDNILKSILDENFDTVNNKSFFLFYSNCLNIELIDNKKIYNILVKYQSILIELIKEENNKEKCEIINELIFIFIKNSKTILNTNIQYKDILHNINLLSNYKIYDYKSLTHKIIFKNKDLVDLFK